MNCFLTPLVLKRRVISTPSTLSLIFIRSNPFKRFEDMQMLHHTRTLGVVQVDEAVWKKLTQEEKQEIQRICDEKLESYFRQLK